MDLLKQGTVLTLQVSHHPLHDEMHDDRTLFSFAPANGYGCY